MVRRGTAALIMVVGFGCKDAEQSKPAAAPTPASGNTQKAAATCAAKVTGAVSGELTGCIAVSSYYASGGKLTEGRKNAMFTLVTPRPASGPVSTLAVNMELAGEPKVGTFVLADAVPNAISGMQVNAAGGTYYDKPKALTLTITKVDPQAEQQDINDEKMRTFQLDGTLTMTLANAEGATVDVQASF